MKLYDWYKQVISNPKYRWWVVLGTLAYLVSPFDIAPDFIPIVGQIDDVVLVTLLVSEVSQILIEKVRTTKSKGTVEVATADQVDVKAVKVE
jgi:uncharacterized membrane protein YkvA (DUF1232 family)